MYKLLGVSKSATTNQIRQAIVARQRGADDALAERILEAERSLLRPTSRVAYDKGLAASRHHPRPRLRFGRIHPRQERSTQADGVRPAN